MNQTTPSNPDVGEHINRFDPIKISVEADRARIVAWLNKQADEAGTNDGCLALGWAAAKIEECAHVHE